MLRRYDVGIVMGVLMVMFGTILLEQEWTAGWFITTYILFTILFYGIGFLIQKDMPDVLDCHYYIRQDKEVRLCTTQAIIGPEYREISWLEYFWYGLEFYAEGLFGEEEE